MAEILSFPTKPTPVVETAPRAVAFCDLQEVTAELEFWQSRAGDWGWLVQADPDPDATRFFVCHSGVDTLPVFVLEHSFDGWERFTRRGELTVYPTLSDALFSVCPIREGEIHVGS